MTYDSVVKEAKDKLEKALGHLGQQLKGIRTGRASSALVDNIRVDYYGTPTPISQMGSVSIPEPRQIVIKPFDPSILKEMGKALQKSDLGVTPEDDGKVLRLNLPPLSGDQRKKYAAKVKEICEETRVAMRNTRRDLNKQADALMKDGTITEDDNKKLHETIQESLKTYEGKVDEAMKKKTEEITEG